jgi:hypothetical protein
MHLFEEDEDDFHSLEFNIGMAVVYLTLDMRSEKSNTFWNSEVGMAAIERYKRYREEMVPNQAMERGEVEKDGGEGAAMQQHGRNAAKEQKDLDNPLLVKGGGEE